MTKIKELFDMEPRHHQQHVKSRKPNKNYFFKNDDGRTVQILQQMFTSFRILTCFRDDEDDDEEEDDDNDEGTIIHFFQ